MDPASGSAMSRRLPSWILVDDVCSRVDDGDLAAVKQSLPPLRLDRGSKQAWGFFEDDQDDVNSWLQSVSLEASLADPPNLSFLTLRGKSFFTQILTADKNLIVFVSTAAPFLTYLIYDAITGSLTMIPSSAPNLEFVQMAHPLIARRRPGDDVDGSYALVLMGKRAVFSKEEVSWKHVLLLWPSFSSSPWKHAKTPILPAQLKNDDGTFVADVTFSFDGRAYLVDLFCGVLHCSCDDLLSDNVHTVQFGFFDLPSQCKVTPPDLRHTGTVVWPSAYRAMGCAGGSIKFVTIQGFAEPVPLGSRKVTVWRLLITGSRNKSRKNGKRWVMEYEISLESLWKKPEFKNAKLPMDLTPMYPILSALEGHVLYFLLGEFYEGNNGLAMPTNAHYLLRVDINSGTLLSATPFPSVRDSRASILLGSELASYLSPAHFTGNDIAEMLPVKMSTNT